MVVRVGDDMGNETVPGTPPIEVFSLAEMLADEMSSRGWTTSDVARRMIKPGQDYVREKLAFDVLMVVSPTKDTLRIDDDTFDSLSRAFGISAGFFKKIHAGWMEWPERRSEFECPEELFGTDVRLRIPPGF